MATETPVVFLIAVLRSTSHQFAELNGVGFELSQAAHCTSAFKYWRLARQESSSPVWRRCELSTRCSPETRRSCYGYPASLGFPDNLQFDPLRPLLRKGPIAAADPRKRTLVIDGAAFYRGNSGGPVFEIDQDFPLTHYYLVCIATEFIPLVQATEDFKMQFNSDTRLRSRWTSCSN